MSTKRRIVKGSGACLIPSVDKLGMAVNDGPDLRHPATFRGVNQFLEVTMEHLHRSGD
jgi:hypothetical protein